MKILTKQVLWCKNTAIFVYEQLVSIPSLHSGTHHEGKYIPIKENFPLGVLHL